MSILSFYDKAEMHLRHLLSPAIEEKVGSNAAFLKKPFAT